MSQGIKTEQQSSLEIAEMNFEEFIEKCGLHEQDVEGKENDQIIEALLPSQGDKTIRITKFIQSPNCINANCIRKLAT